MSEWTNKSVHLWQHIDTQVLTGSAASIIFSGIDTSHRYFRLSAYLIVTVAASSSISGRINLGGTVFDNQHLQARNATATSNATVADGGMNLGPPMGTGGTTIALDLIIQKPVATEYGKWLSLVSSDSIPTTQLDVRFSGGAYLNTADLIDRIDLLAVVTTFQANSRVVLEGMSV